MCHLVCGVVGIQNVKIPTKVSIVKPFMGSHTVLSVGETRQNSCDVVWFVALLRSAYMVEV